MFIGARVTLLLGGMSILLPLNAEAQVGQYLKTKQRATAEVAGAAKPMLPMLDTLPPEALADVEVSLASSGPNAQVVPGNPGPVSLPLILNRSIGSRRSGSGGRTAQAGPVRPAAEAAVPIMPQNFGYGAFQSVYHYSDYLVGSDAQNEAPYRFSGWFYFTNANGTLSRCTASLISRSILVTAGHCVHDGGNYSAGFIQSGTYYPAYRYGESPLFGSASAAWAITTWGWYSQGRLDQGYDVGLVVLNKRVGTTTEIGNYTGWYGACFYYCLQRVWYNSQVGYPQNYYDGLALTQSEHLEISDGRDYIYGSGMQGGSSGGPHVANFGELVELDRQQGSMAQSEHRLRGHVLGLYERHLQAPGSFLAERSGRDQQLPNHVPICL